MLRAGAAAGDPDLRAHPDTVDGERLVGTGVVARRLAELGHLRAGLTVDRARDVIWTLTSTEDFDLVVGQRGWSVEEYVQWAGTAMADAVLEP